MPVSRMRKSRKSASRPKPKANSRSTVPGAAPEGLAGVFSGLLEHRQALDARRSVLAAELAGPLVTELVAFAPGHTDDAVEDELCRRLGSELAAADDRTVEKWVSPEQVAEAILAAAGEAVRGATGGTPDRQAAWRVLTVVARTLPHPLRENADDLIATLAGPGERALDDRNVTGQVLWARDAYGSRFAIAAPFAEDHWYLWDIDTCGFKTFTVHSGSYPTSEQALTAWREGVGEVAGGSAVLTPADDAVLIAELLFRADGILRAGGEHEEHFAEYFRSRRLAEAVLEAVGPGHPPQPSLDEERAAEEFAAWMRSHRKPPEDIDELATELASSWSSDIPEALYGTCSPHRVALAVLHLRNYYKDDFAAELVTLLPDWVSWLSERNGTPAELADRCRPYASGEPHPGIAILHDSEPDYFARTIE